MTSRTRTAKATDTTTPAKKTAAKRTTAAASRPARKRTPRKATADAPKLSLVKARKDLPVRDLDWMTDTQGYATLAARMVGITTYRIRDWRDHRDGTATCPLRDGSTLHYDLGTRTLTWQAVCRMGAIHQYQLNSPSMACAARLHADGCTQLHADLTTVPSLTRDELEALGLHTGPTWARPDLLGDDITETIPVPLPDHRDRALGDELTRSDTGVDETQPIPTLNPDTETPKEHPQP
ncbi:hypothetical protein [Streptomyces sp. AS02]|uniref:hypothetical protein n=1 Tax=Streptomyces sp. AS02 TaxID=2938946 RepID=UPI002020D330|nr:hypothetical protein [Streptomyces sp. AS02]MCL8016925.1 hypothetical protein [Streptomyces sp. AS02]